jgi:hypothetical protein
MNTSSRSGREPTVTRGEPQDLTYTRTQAMLDEKRAELLGTGHHVWVMSVVHVVADPMADPDTISLELDTMVQIIPLHCLGCRIGFRPGLTDTNCGGVTIGPF